MKDTIDNDDIPQIEDEDDTDENREPFIDWNDLD